MHLRIINLADTKVHGGLYNHSWQQRLPLGTGACRMVGLVTCCSLVCS
jgi:hypothetical protein